jgi:thiamine-phosphate pyrophosphorylase
LPPLLFFTDPVRTPHPERTVERLPRGSAVVFRAFGAADALARGRRLASAARRRGVIVLVGMDAALAVRLGADGVHLPERLAGRAGFVRALRRRFLVTAAAHDLPAALRASRAGVQAIVISPVFPSSSPSAGPAMGVRAFATLARAAKTPAYALGGGSAGTARRLAGSGAVGLAGVEALSDGG